MKKLIPILTLVLAAVITTPVAEAYGRCSRTYVSHHHSCGGPAWIETYLAGYDHCGRPVYRSRVIPVHPPRCRPHYPVRSRGGCR